MKGLLVLGIALFVGVSSFAQADYVKAEQEKRAKKDKAYKTLPSSNHDAHGHSPLSKDQKASFKGLAYYDVNPAYNVKAKYIKFKNADHYSMSLTDGHMHHYWVVGKVQFKLNGQDCELLVYEDKKFQESHKEEYKEYKFIPFRDGTNGEGSFAGGRYIQWKESDMIDFNDAFNPTTVYNSAIVVPTVPYVNTLNVKVEAGEKDF